MDWCGGLGFLVILTVIFYVCLVYFKLVKPAAKALSRAKSVVRLKEQARNSRWYQKAGSLLSHRLASVFAYVAVIVVVAVFLLFDTQGDRQ